MGAKCCCEDPTGKDAGGRPAIVPLSGMLQDDSVEQGYMEDETVPVVLPASTDQKAPGINETATTGPDAVGSPQASKIDASPGDAQARPDEKEGDTFTVSVNKDGDQSKLGLVLICSSKTDKKLKVKAIWPGLIDDWNRKSTDKKVQERTVILSVNGVTEPRACAEELAKQGPLTIVMQQPEN
mmetsp:Transcript_21307/g.48974  ORF Transcript_21307/g.48974 Transcript_21307/m.48974 type:complete len:183 (-) Transcript_21307:141-689(-)